MGYYRRTNLKCTKPELIASGSTLNKEYKLNIIDCKGDEIHYLTRKESLHEAILDFSKEHPDVVFTARTWNASKVYEQIVFTLIYRNGDYDQISSEPRYQVSFPNLSEEALKSCYEFIDKIFDFVTKFPPYKLLHPNSNSDDYHASQFRDDRFEVYLKFKWETEDHRFTAENKHGYLIEINYESKDQENLKRLRSDNEMLKKQLKSDTGNSKDQEYDDLPF